MTEQYSERIPHGWHPIATAPIDGTEFLVWHKGNSRTRTAWINSAEDLRNDEESRKAHPYWKPIRTFFPKRRTT